MYVYGYLSINTYHSIIDICTVLFFLTASVTLLTSTLGVLVRDTQMLMQAILRILFYFSPILWLPKNHGISGLIHEIMKYNPVYFIAESYRAAILYHEWYFMDHWKLMLYNFGIVAISLLLVRTYT